MSFSLKTRQLRYLGWTSDIPQHWNLLKLKFISSLNMGQSADSSDYNYTGIGIPFLQGKAEFGASHPQPCLYSESAKKFALKDDILLSVRAPVGELNFADQKYGIGRGLCSITPIEEKCNKDFIRYFLELAKIELLSVSTGSTYDAVTISQVANVLCIVPPIHEQIIIADFLDRETIQIDNLIAAKEQMLTLLEEKREALISHAVTRGLDPNVAFKRSGLDWLGDIPQHWNIERAKNLFSVRDERSDSGDEELLSVSHITGVTSRADKQVNMFKAEDMTGYKRCTKGDFVTNTLWGWMGAMGVSPLDGIVSPDYHVYIFKGDLLPEFMELLCRSKPFIAEVVRWSKGVWSSRLRIYPENFFEIRFPVPPKSEQLELIDKVAKEDEKNKELKNALTDSIALLKERRSALITAAVTGQINIQEMSKHSQNEVSQ
ncbi:type I restriction-modification system, specificity subunit S [Pseudanabaena sp. lw0831]|uniref:restriction endonuclease subunit S n=1 Tax=Pseudanabaena sp. lw0831 TaxID=1357935 RepID=UPI001914F037|nr:restriction endonuclease subunit S [Pseudanabaena sp. lw0831]GBO54826.1 type I restriction-modification system, specificity subunit S [Pseudanabaena sp. lw0831]